MKIHWFFSDFSTGGGGAVTGKGTGKGKGRKGKGIKEKAIDVENKKIIIECRKRYFRPVEVDFLKGNALKAKKMLKWSPKTSVDNLIDDMIQYEL